MGKEKLHKSLEQRYLRLLAEQYSSEQAVESALVKYTAMLAMPKGTEYFFSDLHGEHEAFIHLLRSASGVIRDKIEKLFAQSLLESDRQELAALIYYTEQQLLYKKKTCPRYKEWCEITLHRLVMVCREVTAKYSREKVRNTMAETWRAVLEELLYVSDDGDTQRYYRTMISACISSGASDQVIIALCALIRQISIDTLHIIGDIFDRGPRADRIIDELMRYHDVDIQWGNHDISWMGAASGNLVCVANVLRIGIRYNNFDLLEDGYGINLRPLSVFAGEVYADDPCLLFQPHILDENKYDPIDPSLAAKMHKAMAMIQFKLEGQLALRRPEYGMQDRLLLEKMDLEKGVIVLNGKEYTLLDTSFPTLDMASPYLLTEEENALMDQLASSFAHSAKLRQHMEYLFSHGAMYKATNGNLLYHGCIPLREDGSFEVWEEHGTKYTGKAFFDYIDKCVRQAYFYKDAHDVDLMWYWWCGAKSPVYGKDRMATFERYFIAEEETHTEHMNPYYNLYDDRNICRTILDEFGLQNSDAHIVNGHVPVKLGENPIKAHGMLFVIDGGISKAYQSKTGIAGYTLIYNSHNIALAKHQKFIPASEKGVPPETNAKIWVVEMMPRRKTVEDTDAGKVIKQRVSELDQLLKGLRSGTVH